MRAYKRARGIFLLTRPSRDVTQKGDVLAISSYISTHTSLAGRDGDEYVDAQFGSTFLLTRPSRDVTLKKRRVTRERLISTHTSLAGRDGVRI